MADKNSVIEILKRYPNGLKAKDIAAFIRGADRKSINQILYANPNLFLCDSDYKWTLASKSTLKKEPGIVSSGTSLNRITDKTDDEYNKDYNNFYVQVQPAGHPVTTKIYLYGDSDYILQSNVKTIDCPFCRSWLSVRSFGCPECGHTMFEICEKLYSDWNIDGHRFYITDRAINEYPVNERKRKLYEAIRDFIYDSFPPAIYTHFRGKINEVHLSTLVMIYHKGVYINKVEEEIKEEVYNESLVIQKSIRDNTAANISASARQYLKQAYSNEILVDYESCKRYLACMLLLGVSTSMKYIRNMAMKKLFGDLDLSDDSIIPTANITSHDTLECVEYFRGYHKECDHLSEKVYIKIPLLLQNGDIIIRKIFGTYCPKCQKYFVLDTEFKKILCEGKIQAQISFSESGSHYNGMDLSPESLLRKCGYTVSANSNVTKEQRQKLLKAIIENKLYTPSKIVTHFKFLISMNNNVVSRDMSTAISKWQEDIVYLQMHYS